MKKIAIPLIMAVFSAQLSAQVTYLHSFNASATSVQLGIAGYKYYLMDDVGNECRIYNPDYSLWKTISLGIPAGNYLYDIMYVSDDLFDSDSEVELAYITYEYDTTYYYYTYYLKLINENGSIILDIPGGYYCGIVPVSDSEDRLLVYKGDFSVWPYVRETMVYQLPGQTNIPEPGLGRSYLMPPFPNPAMHQINIPYDLPLGAGSGAVMEIMDQEGRTIREEILAAPGGIYPLSLSGFSPGAYRYAIKAHGQILGTQKFVVVPAE